MKDLMQDRQILYCQFGGTFGRTLGTSRDKLLAFLGRMATSAKCLRPQNLKRELDLDHSSAVGIIGAPFRARPNWSN